MLFQPCPYKLPNNEIHFTAIFVQPPKNYSTFERKAQRVILIIYLYIKNPKHVILYYYSKNPKYVNKERSAYIASPSIISHPASPIYIHKLNCPLKKKSLECARANSLGVDRNKFFFFEEARQEITSCKAESIPASRRDDFLLSRVFIAENDAI